MMGPQKAEVLSSLVAWIKVHIATSASGVHVGVEKQ